MNYLKRIQFFFDTLQERKIISNREIMEIMQAGEADLALIKKVLLNDERVEPDGVTGLKFIEVAQKGVFSKWFGKKQQQSAFEPRFDVFISYSRRNLDYIRQLYEGLIRHQDSYPVRKLSFFFDKKDIKIGDWSKALDTALKNSTGQLVGISDHYFNSKVCEKEWKDFIAYEPEKKLVRDSVYGLVVEKTTLIDNPEPENEWVKEIKSRQIYLDSSKESFPGAETIEAVHEALCLILEKAERAQLPVLNNLPVLNHRKISRHAYLADIYKELFLQPKESYPAVFLVGESGTGKSTLAITYAEAHASQYPGGIFKIEAENIFDLADLPMYLLESMGEELMTADRMDRGLITRKLNLKLENRGEILVILDHIKETEWLKSPDHLKDKFRADARIHWLLLTDTLAGYVKQAGFRYLKIEDFTETEALHLLDSYKTIITPEDDQKAKELLKVIGLKPLKVFVLGAFLFSDADDEEEVLEWEPQKDNYKYLLLDLVYRLSPLEQTILENATYFPHNGILPELLFEFDTYWNSYKRGIQKTSPEEWKEAFRHLELLGFFTQKTEGHFYSIPEDIHRELSLKLTNESKKDDVGAFLMSKVENARISELPVYTEVIFNWVKRQGFRNIDIWLGILFNLNQLGLQSTALSYLKKSLHFKDKMSEFDYVGLLYHHSGNLCDLGLLQESLSSINSCIKICEKSDPQKEGHPLSASYGLKSRILGEWGRLEESLEFIDAALKIQEKSDPQKEGHSLSELFHQKSITLGDLGRLEESLKFIDEAIRIKEKLDRQKESHFLVVSYHQKSAILRELGRLDESLKLIDEEIKICEELYPQKEGSFLASSYHQKSIILRDLGQLEESLDFIDEAIRIKEKLDTQKEGQFLSASYHEKSILLRDLGRLEESLEYINEALKIKEKIDVKNESYSLASSYHQKSIILVELSRLEENLGRHEEALSRLEESLVFIDEAIRIKEKLDIQKEGHSLSSSYHEKSAILRELGRLEESLEFIDEALNIREKLDIQKEGHSLSASYHQKSAILGDLGRQEESLVFIDEAIRIKEKSDSEKALISLGYFYFYKSTFLYTLEHEDVILFLDRAVSILNNYPEHKYYKEVIWFKNKLEAEKGKD